jgi:UDP-glucuronate 4-epimerase
MQLYKDMPVLVTGCAGFIGFHVCKRLCEEGFFVRGVDNFNSYYDVKLKIKRESYLRNNYPQNFVSCHRLDLSDEYETQLYFSKNCRDIGYIIHLAAQAGVRHSFEAPLAYIDSNVVAFSNVLRACNSYCEELMHFVFASSSSVYGANEIIPFSIEDKTNKPLSIYGATKIFDESLAFVYAKNFKMLCTGLRFFTVYGPWGRPDMAYFQFAKNILDGIGIEVYNMGDMSRDFTYIDDIVDGVYLALGTLPINGNAPYQVYNLGSSSPVSLIRFIEILEENIGKRAIIKYTPAVACGDLKTTYADISESAEFLGFAPKVRIEEGLRIFVEWYKKYREEA